MNLCNLEHDCLTYILDMIMMFFLVNIFLPVYVSFSVCFGNFSMFIQIIIYSDETNVFKSFAKQMGIKNTNSTDTISRQPFLSTRGTTTGGAVCLSVCSREKKNQK